MDAHRIRRLGMLSAGAHTQAEAGLVQDEPGDQEQHQSNGNGDVKLLKQRREEILIDLSCNMQLLRGPPGPGGNGDVRDALSLDGPGDDHAKRRGEEVQRRTADGLVRLQIDCGKGQQQGEDHTGQTGNQGRQGHAQLGGEHLLAPTGGVHRLQDQGGGQGAHDHNALQGQVDDAGALGVHPAQGHQHQRNGETNGQIDDTGPCTCAHFACASFFRFFLPRLPQPPDRIIRISRAKAAK